MPKAGDIAVSITLDGSNYSSVAGKIIALNKQTKKSVEDVGHATVSSMQASSAAIRALENPLGNNLRAVERFLTTIPGVGAALQAAFPIVGAVAFTSVVAKMTTELTKFKKELDDMPRTALEGFRALNDSALLANDELRLVNDTLRNHIALMEGKPQNQIAIALDDARIAADKLGDSLRKDQKEIAALLKANSVGMIGQLLGKGGSQDIEGTLIYGEREMTDAGQAYVDAVHGGNPKKIAAVLKALKDKQDYYKKWVTDQQKMRTGQVQIGDNPENGTQSYAAAFGDQSTNLNILQGFGASIALAQDSQSLESDNAKLKGKNDKLDAMKKAQEEQLKQMNEDHDVFQTASARSAADEMTFWSARVETLEKGSLAYNAAFRHQSEERQKMMADTAKQWEAFKKVSDELSRRGADSDLSRDPEYARFLEQSGKDTFDKVKAMNDSIKLTVEFNNAMQDEALKQAVAAGAIAKHDAALQRLSNHYQQYLTEREKAVARGASPDNLQKMDQDRALQFNSDTLEVLNTSFEGQWKSTLNHMANDFTDFGSELTATFKQTVDSLNDEIVKLLTTRHQTGYDTRQQFKAAGKQAFSSLAGVGLKGVEGYGLKALGFGDVGKLGSKSNPIWTRSAEIASMNSAAASSASGGFGNILGKLIGFLPHFATGGAFSAGTMAVVGERGPEIASFGSSGRIIPNDAIGGDTHHHHYNIDARGSTSPMETKRIVMQALIGSKDSIIKASLHASRDYSRRRPSMGKG